MVGRNGASVDEVAHGRAKSALIAEGAEHIVEQRGDGSLTVRSRHAHQLQTRSGVTIELGGHLSNSILGVVNANISHAGRNLCRNGFAHQHRLCPQFEGLGDVLVAIGLRPFDRHEEVAGLHLT